MHLYRLRLGCLAVALVALTVTGLAANEPAPAPIILSLDATQAARKMFHARMMIPVSPGPLTLLYPKWIPGEHGPTGPLVNLMGLRFTVGGKALAWRRDLAEMYAVHLDVPAGASTLEVELDYVSPGEQRGFSSGASASAQAAVISWNQVLLYPAGSTANDLTFRASLRLPPGWRFGTALPTEGPQQGDTVQFAPVSLYTLVDSPVIVGAFLRVVPLNPGQTPPVEIDVAGDSSAAISFGADVVGRYQNLVAEGTALFGATHYRNYHFLLTLSDHVAHFGLEHHESSDNRYNERALIDPNIHKLMGSLLPHEYVHSWNGKYRRPAGLATTDYQKPMKTDLLWVYEGLTSYLGDVLAARSGIWTPEQFRDYLAAVASELDQLRPGRAWRPLQDTADDAQILYRSAEAWRNWRRSADFYGEGTLLWLEVDTIIRKQTGGQRSIDDFCKVFFGAPGGPPEVKPYTFDDVVAALNQVAPYDWRDFWATRLSSTSPRAPLGGIENSGWRVIYNDVASDMVKSDENENKIYSFGNSIGFSLRDDGTVVDTIMESPAAKAGIGPGMRIVAVDGRRWTLDVLHDALKAGTAATQPMELLAVNGDYFKTFSVDYHGGDRYPHLQRNETTPDLLQDILRPHAGVH